MKLKRSSIESEDNGKLNWPKNAADMYVIMNKDIKNKYGEYPGYRIFPGWLITLNPRTNFTQDNRLNSVFM